jgi:hypothetical protein
MEVAPDMAMSITLQAQQWNQIIGVLFDTPHLPLPHRAVAPLIQTIHDQLQQQATTAAQSANGLDHAPPPMRPPAVSALDRVE